MSRDTVSSEPSPKKAMQISASQLSTWKSCHRKWWFENCHRGEDGIQLPPKQATFVGTVGHAVVERFLKADDTGRDRETGQPVNLYPEGWATVQERGQQPYTLTTAEQEHVKRIIASAIEQGFLRRDPGRRIEDEIVEPVLVEEGDLPAVRLKGKIDVNLPGAFQDHKFLGNMKYAASSRKNASRYLGEDNQVLTYAAVKFRQADRAGEELHRIHAKHNVFSKDPQNPVVKEVPVWIERERAEEHWHDVTVQADAMRRLRAAGISAKDWPAVKGPCEEGACSAYGGCPFADVCSRLETIEQYVARVKRLNSPELPQSDTTSEKPPMDPFANLPKAKPAVQTAAQAAPATQTATAVAEPPAKRAETPPWFNASCKACCTNPQPGFNTSGDPCRMCDIAATKAGRPTSLAFNIWIDESGKKRWAALDGSSAGEAPAAGPAPAVKQAAPQAAPAQAQTAPAASAPAQTAPAAQEASWASMMGEAAPAAKPPAQPAPTVSPALQEALAAVKPVVQESLDAAGVTDEDANEPPTLAQTAQAIKSAKRAVGRPKKGFRLLIGAVSLGSKCDTAERIFGEIGAEMAAAGGVDSFFQLDTFKRRELWPRNAANIAERVNGVDIVCPVRPDPDLGAMIAALKPLAAEVIVGAAA